VSERVIQTSVPTVVGMQDEPAEPLPDLTRRDDQEQADTDTGTSPYYAAADTASDQRARRASIPRSPP
jgi:hypothetical protein